MQLLMITLLVAMVPLALCQMGDEWVITINPEFQDVSFECNNTFQDIPADFYPELWMLPDLTNIDKNYSDGRISVMDDGYRLVVLNASRYDFGLYHCMTQNMEGDWYLVKWGLNVRGPYFEDVWEKYETGTFVGISVCLGFIASVFLIWSVVAHQWVAPEGWYEDEGEEFAKEGGTRAELGYANHAFTNDKPPEGAKGYVEVRDNRDSLKAASSLPEKSELKAPQVENGKSRVGVEESGDSMITEL